MAVERNRPRSPETFYASSEVGPNPECHRGATQDLGT